MAEDSNIILNSEDQSLGTIQIAPRVLEIIAGIAAGQIEGVSRAWLDCQQSVNYWGVRPSSGVKLSNSDDELSIDVDVYLNMAFPFLRLLLRFKIKSSSRLR